MRLIDYSQPFTPFSKTRKRRKTNKQKRSSFLGPNPNSISNPNHLVKKLLRTAGLLYSLIYFSAMIIHTETCMGNQ